MDASNLPPAETLSQEQVEDVEKNKDVAAASYLWILSLVVLYKRRDSPFVQHHAKQAVWLFVLSILLWMIPGVGHLLEFFVLAGMIIGFLSAAQGRSHDLPLIGALAKGTLTLRDLWKMSVAFIARAVDTLKRAVGVGKPKEKPVAQAPETSAKEEGGMGV